MALVTRWCVIGEAVHIEHQESPPNEPTQYSKGIALHPILFSRSGNRLGNRSAANTVRFRVG